VVRQNGDGSFALDMDYFCFHHSTDKTFNGRFEALSGNPRPSDLHFFTAGTGLPKYFGEKPSNYNELCKVNQHYANIAASIQKVTEELLVGMAKSLQQLSGQKRLCIAGGVGLDSVANTRILRGTGLRDYSFSQQPSRRWRRLAGRSAVGLQQLTRKAARLSHGPCLLGPALQLSGNRVVSGHRQRSVPGVRP
jgi:hypothetical protein